MQFLSPAQSTDISKVSPVVTPPVLPTVVPVVLTEKGVTDVFRDLVPRFGFREVTEFFVEQSFKLKYKSI